MRTKKNVMTSYGRGVVSVAPGSPRAPYAPQERRTGYVRFSAGESGSPGEGDG